MTYQSGTLRLDKEKCTGCGMCVDVCPHAVFTLTGHKAGIQALQRCMECGACQRNCPADAIQVATGVGCAAAMIQGALKGTAPTCGCSSKKKNGAGHRSPNCC